MGNKLGQYGVLPIDHLWFLSTVLGKLLPVTVKLSHKVFGSLFVALIPVCNDVGNAELTIPPSELGTAWGGSFQPLPPPQRRAVAPRLHGFQSLARKIINFSLMISHMVSREGSTVKDTESSQGDIPVQMSSQPPGSISS